MSAQPRNRPAPSRQRGYTLIEILVALLIAIFLLAGLFTILQNTRRSSSNQTGLTQLQDEQRMAMSLLNDVIQNAGYFDTNTYSTPQTAWNAAVAVGATGTSLAAGQAVTGSHATAAPGDVIAVRYATAGGDGIINCNGGVSATAQNYINTFMVVSNQLECATNGVAANAIPLVSGVHNLQVWYGVSTSAATNNVDTYFTADQMSASNWQNVTSVRVTLTFLNPLYGQAGYTASTSQYVYFTRVIALQGRTGVIPTNL
jgi:type IV pilus assembly protein PilW